MSAATLATHAGAASHQGKAKQNTTKSSTAGKARQSNRAAGWKQQHRATTKQHKSPETRGKEKRKGKKKKKKSITYTGKGGIAYEKVKEEKTRNPSWVHELWDEVLL